MNFCKHPEWLFGEKPRPISLEDFVENALNDHYYSGGQLESIESQIRSLQAFIKVIVSELPKESQIAIAAKFHYIPYG